MAAGKSTQFKEALELRVDKSFAKIIVLPPTLGIGKAEVKVLDKSNFILTSEDGYLIFSPNISHYTVGKPVIETPDYILTVTDKYHLNLSLKNDYLGKEDIIFWQYRDERLLNLINENE